jgi:hypothetical protein
VVDDGHGRFEAQGEGLPPLLFRDDGPVNAAAVQRSARRPTIGFVASFFGSAGAELPHAAR